MAYKFQLGAFTASGSIKAEEGFDANEQNIQNVGDIRLDSISADNNEIDITLADNQAAALEIKEGSNVYQKFVTTDGSEAVEFMKKVDFGAQVAQGNNFDINGGDIASGVTINKSPEVTLAGDLGGSATFTNLGDATLTATIQAAAVEHGMLAEDIISGQAEHAHADILDADDLMIHDSANSEVKKVGVDSLRDHYFAAVSGDATIADGGALTIAAGAVEDSMLDDDVAAGLAGAGLSAASGVMAVEVSGAMRITSDKVAISGSIAGLGLKYDGGVDSISELSLDMNELSSVAIDVAADSFAFIDADDNNTKKESIADLVDAMAGSGLASSNGVMSLDMSEASAGAVAVGADSFLFIDADDSNATKKESIADLADAQAGAGMTATSGVFNVINATNGGLDVQANDIKLDIGNLAAMGGVADEAADFLAVWDNDATQSKKITIANFASTVAGEGLAQSGGQLDVQVSGAVRITSDKVAISGSIAELNGGLAYSGGVDSISGLKVLPANSPNIANATLIASNDLFLIGDQSDGNAAKNITLATLATKMAGLGLTEDADGILDVEVDDSTIELSGDAIQLKDNGTTLAKLEDLSRGSIIYGNSSAATAELALGSANTVLFSNGSDLAYGQVSNDMLAGSIANSKLVNDSVTLTAGAGMAAIGEVELGASITVAVDGVLEDLDTLGAASADGEFIVATGAGAFAYESGNTARTSLGLGTGDSPQFTDLTLSGDLTVNGSMITLDVTNLEVEDTLIGLGFTSGSVAAAVGDRGLILGLASEDNVSMFWDESATRFRFAQTDSAPDATAVNVTGDADLQVGTLYADSIESVIVESVQTISADATLSLASGTIVLCDSASGDVTITLPAASGNSGKIVKFKKIASANNVVIDPDSGASETVDGEASITLESPFAAVSLFSDGADWFVM